MKVPATNGRPRDQLRHLADQFVDVVLALLTERLVKNAGGSVASNGEAEDEEDDYGPPVRRGKKKKRGRGPNVASESILAIFKERGALTVPQLQGITGLTPTTLYKKIKELKATGSVKRVRGEGHKIMWKAARDGRSRVTAEPSSKKRGKNGKKAAEAAAST